MEIRMMPIAALKPYARNPRNNERAVAAVAASIRDYGFRQPIIVDGDNVIVAGHTRWLAAQKLGLTEVPTISAADLTAKQIKAFRLVDNKAGEIAKWNWDLLNDELAALEKDRVPLELFETHKKIDKAAKTAEREWNLVIRFTSEKEAEQLFNRLKKEGYKCSVIR